MAPIINPSPASQVPIGVPGNLANFPSQSTSESILDRTSRFVRDNKVAVTAFTALVVAGTGYYVYTNSNRYSGNDGGSDSGSQDGSSEKVSGGAGASGSAAKKNKKKSKSKKFLKGDGTNGPLLEEIPGAAAAAGSEGVPKKSETPSTQVDQASSFRADFPDQAQIDSMSEVVSVIFQSRCYILTRPAGEERERLAAEGEGKQAVLCEEVQGRRRMVSEKRLVLSSAH